MKVLTTGQVEMSMAKARELARSLTGKTDEELFVERYENVAELPTIREVESHLAKVRAGYSPSFRWGEIDAYALQLPRGKYKAVRWHYQIK